MLYVYLVTDESMKRASGNIVLHVQLQNGQKTIKGVRVVIHKSKTVQELKECIMKKVLS